MMAYQPYFDRELDREETHRRRGAFSSPSPSDSARDMHPRSRVHPDRLHHSPLRGEGDHLDDFKAAGALSPKPSRNPTYPPGAALPYEQYHPQRAYFEDALHSATALSRAMPDRPLHDYEEPHQCHDHSRAGNRTHMPPSLFLGSYYMTMDSEEYARWSAAGAGGVRRTLVQKNLSMIAIAGTIGTGLFVSSGEALSNGGPVGLLLSSSIMATVVYSIMSVLAEMCTRYPLTSSYTHYAARFIDEPAGFCLGFTNWWSYAVAVPAEISTAAIIIQYWDHSTNPAVYITLFILGVLGVNILGVHYFGEVNFWLSLPKLITVVGLILLGFILALGGGPLPSTPDGWCLAFHCWQAPGAFAQLYGIPGAKGRFLGFWDTMLRTAFAYEGFEVIALSAGEASNPQRSMPTSIRHGLHWITWSYIGAVVVIGWTVPFDAPDLQQSDIKLNSLDVAQSPFVIASKMAGIRALDSIINAVVLLSAFTTSSVTLYGGSRSLIGLADEILRWSEDRRQEPGFVEKCAKGLRRCRRDGLPHYALAVTSCFMPLAYALSGTGKGTGSAYLNLVTAGAASGLITWWMILLSYLRFYFACQVRHEDRGRFKYTAPLQPWLTYWGIFWVSLVLIFNGFEVFVADRWDTSGFIASYITFPAVAFAYFSWRWTYSTNTRSVTDIDIAEGAAFYEEYDSAAPKASVLQTWWTWAF